MTTKEDAQELLDAFGTVQIVGEERGLVSAARVWVSIGLWMNQPSRRADREGWATARATTDDAVSGFISGARADLGLKE